MAVTVKDLLRLEIMNNFKVVAGEKGLNNTISATEILDFEFTKDGNEYRKVGFDGDSITLSSLLFAKDDPGQILNAVKRLRGYGVRAFAYKPVFFKTLPNEVIEYANERNFPILEFGNDEFFEDIIFAVKSLVEADNSIYMTEEMFRKIVEKDFEESQSTAWKKCNHNLDSYLMAVCLKVKNQDQEDVVANIKKNNWNQLPAMRTFVGKIEDKYMMVLSSEEGGPEAFDDIFRHIMKVYGLEESDRAIGISRICSRDTGFFAVVREAYWAQRISEITRRVVTSYKDLGIYKFIIENIHRAETKSFMEEYLLPIKQDQDGELMKTAVEYVLAEGDLLATADKMFCHKNTVRYRIGKLQERLDPNLSEKEFYVNLSAAIKIYLLLEKTTQ